MKKLLYLIPIFLLGLLFVQCRDEEKPNRPPSAFELTDDNFKVMYNAGSKTVSMDWANVSDPDGQDLTYRVAVNGQEKGKDLKETQQALAEFIAAQYTGIDGKLIIKGSGITDISGLKDRLVTVTGDIHIYKTNLQNLDGLSSIKGYNGNITIGINNQLKEVNSFLSTLTKVRGIHVAQNPLLTNINLSNFSTLVSSSSLYSSINITGNDALTELSINPNLVSEVKLLSIHVSGNKKLTGDIVFNEIKSAHILNLDGATVISFPKLERVEGEATISESLYFPILTEVGGLYIDNITKEANFNNLENVNFSLKISNIAAPLEFPKLKEVAGDININNTPNTGELNLGNLEHVRTMYIDKTGFTSLKLPNLKSTKSGYMAITNNHNLTRIDANSITELKTMP